MRQFLKKALVIAICVFVTGMLFTTLAPPKSAHAATTRPTGCGAGWSFSPGSFELEADASPDNYYQASIDWLGCDGSSHFTLAYQDNGDLVLNLDGTQLWDTNTIIYDFCITPGYVSFQGDGNFVVYNYCTVTGHYYAVWSTGTNNRGATSLELQDDGNLVIYKNNSTSPSNALWASNTCCH